MQNRGSPREAEIAPTRIRRLEPGDAALYRDIRLEGLREHPEAFGSTLEAESAQPLTWFSERVASSGVFGAFHGAEFVGVAGLLLRQGKKDAHKGFLWGMYVRAHARRLGVGRRLVEVLIEFARPRVELIQLAVVRGNDQARRLYESFGFVEYGVEKNALKQDGRYYDEILMAKDLRANS